MRDEAGARAARRAHRRTLSPRRTQSPKPERSPESEVLTGRVAWSLGLELARPRPRYHPSPPAPHPHQSLDEQTSQRSSAQAEVRQVVARRPVHISGPARPSSARPGPRPGPATTRRGSALRQHATECASVCLGVPRCASARCQGWATGRRPLLAARSAARSATASDLPPPLICRRPCLPRAGRRGAQGHRAGRGAGAQHPGAPPSRHAPASAPRLGTPPRHLASPPASPPFAPLCTPSASSPLFLQARQNARRTQQQETARPTFSTRPTPPHPTPPPPHERQPQPQPRTPPRPLLPIPTRRSTTWRRSRPRRRPKRRSARANSRTTEGAPARCRPSSRPTLRRGPTPRHPPPACPYTTTADAVTANTANTANTATAVARSLNESNVFIDRFGRSMA